MTLGEREIAELEKVTKAEVVDFFRRIVLDAEVLISRVLHHPVDVLYLFRNAQSRYFAVHEFGRSHPPRMMSAFEASEVPAQIAAAAPVQIQSAEVQTVRDLPGVKALISEYYSP